MKRILATAAVLVAVGGFLLLTLGSSGAPTGSTYTIELDNAFGLVTGSDFKVGGVIVGSLQKIDLDPKTLHALVTVSVNKNGFGNFHQNVSCQSRPQSLIGEYFVDCDPGTASLPVWPASKPIPVSHTQSTIPADLVQNIMRLPYRERFSLIINELGAAVAARSEDLQSALRRADPALAETDNLLNLLANDATTIRDLNVSANQVITALARNKTDVQRFIVEANNAATDSASPQANSSCSGTVSAACIQQTWDKLPGFLEQLRPAMQKLGAAADAQTPVFENLQAASRNLKTFFTQLVPFSKSSRVSLACGDYGEAGCPNGGASLGTASQTGKPAVIAARPLARHLNTFAKPTPELAQNLAIVLQALDARKPIPGQAGGAVEPDPRSPDGGIGYTGLEGLLQYAFNITNAISYFTPYGHELAVDALANSTCSPYADQQSIAKNLQTYQQGGGNLNSFNPQNPRTCYAWLGPNQQGVNEPDPSNPGACVPDPGGYPVQGFGTHYYGAGAGTCKQQPNPLSAAPDKSSSPSASTAATNAPRGSPGGGSSSSSGATSQTAAQIVNQLASNGALGSTSGATSGAPSGASAAASGSQAQQLLNYLLSP